MKLIYFFPRLLFRLFLLISLTICFVSLPEISLAQGSKIDRTETLHELFKYIEKQGKYKVFYNDNVIDVNQKITIDKTETDVKKLLNQAFKGTMLSYRIIKDQIVITIQKKSSNQNQSINVKGEISDQKDEPLIGVSVVLKGTFHGAVSDLNGAYQIAASKSDTLIFSYVGFKTVIVPIHGQNQIDISMKPSSISLNEVVAIGYGVEKKSDVIGAISVVDSKDISGLPVANVSDALAGQASGVSVTQNTGAPGSGTSIRIRGIGTINNNSPLFIVDGVPTEDASSIPPSDIQSISVLKDAAASSIYGSRASNGVILITTKKGKEGRMRINFNTYTGIQQVGHLTPMANKSQYIAVYNAAAKNDGRSIISPQMADSLPNTNWWNQIFRTAIMTSTNISVSGGSKSTDYLVSGNYFKQDGIIPNSDYKRYTFRTSLDSKLSKKINIGTNLNLSTSTTNEIGSSGDGTGGNGGSVVRYAFFRTPIFPVKDKNGNYIDYYPKDAVYFGDGYNPVALAYSYDWKVKQNTLLGDAFLNWIVVDNLNFRTEFGIDYTATNDKRFNETWGYQDRINNPNSLSVESTTNAQYTYKSTLTYSKIFNHKHSINLFAGFEVILNNLNDFSASAKTFPDQIPSLRYLANGTTNQQVSGYQSNWSLVSFFGRASYNFEGKYYAKFVLRRDGSSRFGSNYPWALFPAAALGWRVDKEAFMKNLGFISYLKLRASAGVLGNQAIGDYSFASLMTSGGYYPFGSNVLSGYYLSQLGNADLRWESQTQFDGGFDLGLFGNKLFLYFDYYNKISDNVLLRAPLPPSSGSAAPPFINAGKIQNQGIGIKTEYKDQIGKLRFDVSLNLSHMKNNVLSLYHGTSIPAGRIDNGVYATLTEPGYPIGSFYLYVADGIFQNETQILTHAYQGPNVRPGDVMYKDISGPNGVPDGIINGYDRKHVGNPNPDFTMGVNLSMNYKKWDFSALVQGVYGNSVYWQAAKDVMGFYRAFNVTQSVYSNSWTGPGTSNTYPIVSWNDAPNNDLPSTRFLFNGSYIRFKNINLGYTFTNIGRKKNGISSLRIYVSGQNLLTITKYPGLDPEMQTSNNSTSGDLAKGIDWGTYPISRVYTLGINMNF